MAILSALLIVWWIVLPICIYIVPKCLPTYLDPVCQATADTGAVVITTWPAQNSSHCHWFVGLAQWGGFLKDLLARIVKVYFFSIGQNHKKEIPSLFSFANNKNSYLYRVLL